MMYLKQEKTVKYHLISFIFKKYFKNHRLGCSCHFPCNIQSGLGVKHH